MFRLFEVITLILISYGLVGLLVIMPTKPLWFTGLVLVTAAISFVLAFITAVIEKR